MGQFSKELNSKGEFYTPSCIVRLLVELLKPTEGKVYDPCIGTGGMVVQSALFGQKNKGKKLKIYGQDSNGNTLKLCKMNLFMRGLEADLGSEPADIFKNDLHPTLKADYILANPPFNQMNWNTGNITEKDKRFPYGLSPYWNGNLAWLQLMMSHLSPAGKIGVVFPNGALTNKLGGEREVRAKIVESDLIESIIILPQHLFFAVKIPVSLWIINKQKRNKGKVLFIDGSAMGKPLTKSYTELTADEIGKIVAAYDSFAGSGKFKPEAGFSGVATLASIKEHDYNLTPIKYLERLDTETDTESFADKKARLVGEYKELYKKSGKLEKEVLAEISSLEETK
jgi:type I restriction enzyme M protein